VGSAWRGRRPAPGRPTASRLTELLRDLLREDARVVVDLTDASFIDSTILNILLEAHSCAGDDGLRDRRTKRLPVTTRHRLGGAGRRDPGASRCGVGFGRGGDSYPRSRRPGLLAVAPDQGAQCLVPDRFGHDLELVICRIVRGVRCRRSQVVEIDVANSGLAHVKTSATASAGPVVIRSMNPQSVGQALGGGR